MFNARDIQQGVSDLSMIIGLGMMYGGGAALFIMAVVGTLAIDLVLLCFLMKEARSSRGNPFLTGFLLGALCFRPGPTGGVGDMTSLLIASPITSGIAVALAFGLGVPVVGLAILAGWLAAATLLLIGYAATALAEAIKPAPAIASPVCAF